MWVVELEENVWISGISRFFYTRTLKKEYAKRFKNRSSAIIALDLAKTDRAFLNAKIIMEKKDVE